jgi:adenylosuccinate synthase
MPTADTEMTESLLPGSHKNTNRYQGNVRVGPLDLNLLRYAIEVGGGPVTFDGLAITWFDQIRANGVWHLCERYQNTSDRNFFSPSGAIKVRRWEGDRKREWQEALGEHLGRSVPVIASHTVPPNASVDELYRFCADILGKNLGVPVRMVSFGPTERDTLCR